LSPVSFLAHLHHVSFLRRFNPARAFSLIFLEFEFNLLTNNL